MNARTLLPWLLGGALLASVFVNQMMYARFGQEPGVSGPPVPSRTAGLLAVHPAVGSTQERCPTLDRLRLTDEQRDVIRKCTLTSLGHRTDMALEIEQASTELDRLLAEATIDPAEVLRIAGGIADLRSRQYKAWIGSILVVRDVLTPEQLKLLREGQDR